MQLILSLTRMLIFKVVSIQNNIDYDFREMFYKRNGFKTNKGYTLCEVLHAFQNIQIETNILMDDIIFLLELDG